MAPPKVLAPIKTGSNAMRPERASGNTSAAKAMQCTNLSILSNAWYDWVKGQSIVMISVNVTTIVIRMSM